MNFTKIMKYEDGQMEFDEQLELFQELIDSGLAWRLQGHYGREAMRLINEGLCYSSMAAMVYEGVL